MTYAVDRALKTNYLSIVCKARTKTQICAQVKDPISICRKKKERSRPHSRWYVLYMYGHTKILHTASHSLIKVG